MSLIAAVGEEGLLPLKTDIDEFARRPDPRPPTTGLGTRGSRFRMWMTLIEDTDPGAAMSDHLVRIGWAGDLGDRIALTDMGAAVLRSLDRRAIEVGEVLEVALDDNDPLALPVALQHINKVGPALLVDPYFRVQDLLPVINATSISRILTSPKAGQKDLEALRLGVDRIRPGRALEVRVAADALHDRYVIPDSGSTWFIGASINGIGQSATVIGPLNEVSDAIRRRYETAWKAAEKLAVADPN